MLTLTINHPHVERALMDTARVLHKEPCTVLLESFLQQALGIPSLDFLGVNGQIVQQHEPEEAMACAG